MSLNVLANNSTYKIIQTVLDRGVKLTHVSAVPSQQGLPLEEALKPASKCRRPCIPGEYGVNTADARRFSCLGVLRSPLCMHGSRICPCDILRTSSHCAAHLALPGHRCTLTLWVMRSATRPGCPCASPPSSSLCAPRYSGRRAACRECGYGGVPGMRGAPGKAVPRGQCHQYPHILTLRAPFHATWHALSPHRPMHSTPWSVLHPSWRRSPVTGRWRRARRWVWSHMHALLAAAARWQVIEPTRCSLVAAWQHGRSPGHGWL